MRVADRELALERFLGGVVLDAEELPQIEPRLVDVVVVVLDEAGALAHHALAEPVHQLGVVVVVGDGEQARALVVPGNRVLVVCGPARAHRRGERGEGGLGQQALVVAPGAGRGVVVDGDVVARLAVVEPAGPGGEPTLLHQFDPQSKEKAFPCPRTWHFTSNIVHRRNGLDPAVERALFRGTIGEAAAVEFAAFLKVWRELPHPRAVIGDPENADIPENASALMALCGSLYRMASDVNFDAIVTYAARLRREVGEFLVGSCVRREPALQRSPGFIRWGRRQDPVRETPMTWRITYYPAGDAPSRDYAVRAPSLDTARRELADALNVPLWTLR